MATQKDIKSRISSVKNIRKITRAMEMVAAARLRRAEQRIEQLRPYADAIRRMTRRAVEAAESIPSLPLLEEHDSIDRVGLLLVTGDRGLAGAFNSQIIRGGNRRAKELEGDGKQVSWYASGRRGVSSIEFRGLQLAEGFTGFTDRPAYGDARNIAERRMRASRTRTWKSSRGPRSCGRHPEGDTWNRPPPPSSARKSGPSSPRRPGTARAEARR